MRQCGTAGGAEAAFDAALGAGLTYVNIRSRRTLKSTSRNRWEK